MALSGRKLRRRLRVLLQRGREELRPRVTQEKAARVLAGAPSERTLRAWEGGEVELKQLHYAVGLGRRSETFRAGLITLMNPNPAEWQPFMVPRRNLYPLNLRFLRDIAGAVPVLPPDTIFEADMAEITEAQQWKAVERMEQQHAERMRRRAEGKDHVLRTIERLPEDDQLRSILVGLLKAERGD